MTRPWDVIGIGATSVDYVYRLPARPEAEGPHSKIRISSHTVSCGGQMATALAACATLGLRSKFAGVIGSDDNGTRVQEALVARGVEHFLVKPKLALAPRHRRRDEELELGPEQPNAVGAGQLKRRRVLGETRIDHDADR